MSMLPQKSIEDIHELRREAGRWLRGLRESNGLSQRDLAQMTGTEYYTFVSQLETGRGRIPPENYLQWAEALGVEPKLFVKTLMQYYDPVTYDILFPKQKGSLSKADFQTGLNRDATDGS
jgi:transcriptional regulator with XRE-family HTH domain